jgi:hypothetical protein
MSVRVSSHFILALSALLLLPATVVHAQRIHQIESVLPRTAQRGTMLDVTIRGTQLVEPEEIIFYRPGIKCTAIGAVVPIINEAGKAQRYGLAHGGIVDQEVRCRFEVADDCPLGEHPFHLRRKTAITQIGSIHVTPFAIVDEAERGLHTNDTRATALPLTEQHSRSVTVRGFIKQTVNPDVDVYRVAVLKGQRVSVEVDMVRITDMRIGASEVDVAVRVLDEDGKEIASGDDSPLHIQDPIVTAIAPKEGFVYIEVKQSTYTPFNGTWLGLGGIPYALQVYPNARALSAYPAGSQQGTNPVVTFGIEGSVQAMAVKFPDTLGFFESYNNTPSPIALRSSPYPNVLEHVPTPSQLQAAAKEKKPLPPTKVDALPAALNGIIAKPGEVDTFRLSVKKGERWRVRAFASALGTPLDPILRIRPINKDAAGAETLGEVELEGDDTTPQERDIFGHYPRSGGGFKDVLDPSLIWSPKADGDYLIEITDNAGLGSPTSVYRIEIEPTSDGVCAVLFWQGLQVSQGSRQAYSFRLENLQGNTYDGPFDIVATGLPEGVTFHCPRIPKGQAMPIFEWPMMFEATNDVKPGSALVKFEVRAADTSQAIRSEFQSKAPFIYQTGGDSFHLIELTSSALAVNDPAPFSIEVAPPATALVRSGELALPVKITRRPGFVEPITLDFHWLPTGVGKEAALTIPDGQTEAVLKMSAASNAKLGDWPLTVRASTVLDPKRAGLSIVSPFTTLSVAEPYVELAAQPDSLRRGERKRYTWSVKSKSPFDGSATAKLLGLPKGVTQIGPMPTLDKNTSEITFEIEATDEALLGPIAGVACEIVLQAGGQEIHQRSGSATLRIDPKL